MPILLASPGVFVGYKALAACLALKRNAESHTRADADKMSALPAQPADRPEKLPRRLRQNGRYFAKKGYVLRGAGVACSRAFLADTTAAAVAGSSGQ